MIIMNQDNQFVDILRYIYKSCAIHSDYAALLCTLCAYAQQSCSVAYVHKAMDSGDLSVCQQKWVGYFAWCTPLMHF